jgi:hypothetical protein
LPDGPAAKVGSELVRLTVPLKLVTVFPKESCAVMVSELFVPATRTAPGTRNFANGPGLTVSEMLFEFAALKLLSLAMLAVTELDPIPSALVVQLALNPESGTEVQPAMALFVPFSVVLKLTLPVGVMPLDGVAAAIKVTGLFTVDEPLAVERLNEGVPLVIVCETGRELAMLKLASPASAAVMLLEPAASALVVQDAVKVVALTSGTAVQPAMALVVPLSVVLKLTVPVGRMPLVGDTDATKVH